VRIIRYGYFRVTWRASGLHTDWEKYASSQPALRCGRNHYYELTWMQCRCGPGFIDIFLFPIETSPERDHDLCLFRPSWLMSRELDPRIASCLPQNLGQDRPLVSWQTVMLCVRLKLLC
jgi:hypothetical protein